MLKHKTEYNALSAGRLSKALQVLMAPISNLKKGYVPLLLPLKKKGNLFLGGVYFIKFPKKNPKKIFCFNPKNPFAMNGRDFYSITASFLYFGAPLVSV